MTELELAFLQRIVAFHARHQFSPTTEDLSEAPLESYLTTRYALTKLADAGLIVRSCDTRWRWILTDEGRKALKEWC